MITASRLRDAAPVAPLVGALHELGLTVIGHTDRDMGQAADYVLADRRHTPILHVLPHHDTDGCVHPQQLHLSYSLRWTIPAICPKPGTGCQICAAGRPDAGPVEDHLYWDDLSKITDVRATPTRGERLPPSSDMPGLDWPGLDWPGLARQVAEVAALRPPRLDRMQRVAAAGARVFAAERTLAAARASLSQYARNAWTFDEHGRRPSKAELAGRAGISRPTLDSYLNSAPSGS